jgi:GWxTD domain-containing protein
MPVLYDNTESKRGRLFRAICGLIVVASLVVTSGVGWAEQKKKPKLPKYYTNWLDRDVAYIITKPERKDFLQLTSDDERDNFIQRFWDVRNPTPGSPSNTYKDEIYQRIAYADAHFGIGSGEEGWRTDRGRTYITLGPPQQTEKHYGAANLRPIEIWFYSNLNPALPPFFYVLFYQRDNVGDFRYYSPSLDGPDKLVSGMEAINDPQSALKIIQSSVGPEVARVAQTLIPGEPIDPSGRPSLQSDVMLSILRNLANQPSNIDEINRRREMNESVVSRMIVDSENLNIVLFPIRDERGLTRLDYAVRLGNPRDLSLTKSSDGHEYSYSVEARVRVYTDDTKLIFTQQKSISDHLDEPHLDEIKHRVFGYEGILPLPPGKYHLDFLLTDWNQKVGFHAERDVLIPGNVVGTFAVPAILPFSSAEAVDKNKQATTPFAMSGLRFKPLQGTRLFFNSTEDLKVTYQIWAPPKPPEVEAGQNLIVQYALGEPALSGTATILKDTVDMGQFTSSGSLVNGKKISLVDKPNGNYMLTVSVSGPGTSQKTYSSLTFQILNDVPFNLPWDVDEPGIGTDEAKGILDQQRGLCYVAQGNSAEARLWFRLALSKNHSDDISRARLVEAYYTLNAYPAIVSLLDDAGITAGTDSGTIVQIAESLLKTGNTSKAVSLLKDTIHTRPEDGPLYLALADAYQQMGDSQGALEMSRKGRGLLSSNSIPK